MTRRDIGRRLADAFNPRPSGRRPVARTCDHCGKPRAVSFYAIEIDGRMTSVALHLPCVAKFKAGK